MRIYLEQEVPQGSAAWHRVRMGIPTASRMDDVVQESTGELSVARDKKGMSKVRAHYAYQLIAERILQEPFATDVSGLQWIVHGKEREDEAARMYAEITGTEPFKVGFVAADHGRWGCSPDRLVLPGGVRGAAEIKAPKETTQVQYLLEGPGTNYKPQVQTQILICELNWADFFSHNERMPPVNIRFDPDYQYLKNVEVALRTFADELDDMEKRVRAMGYFAPAAVLVSDADRLANSLIADIDRLRGLQQILDKEGEEAFHDALGIMPREQQQRVREAIESNKQLLRAGA